MDGDIFIDGKMFFRPVSVAKIWQGSLGKLFSGQERGRVRGGLSGLSHSAASFYFHILAETHWLDCSCVR